MARRSRDDDEGSMFLRPRKDRFFVRGTALVRQLIGHFIELATSMTLNLD